MVGLALLLQTASLVTKVSPTRVYVGQQATYDAVVVLNAEAQGRLKSSPEYTPPQIQGVVAYDLPMTGASDGRAGQGYLFRRALFPLREGRIAIPPALLEYTVPPAEYYGKAERVRVNGEARTLDVQPLPDEGRPNDFSGAVGEVTISVTVDPLAARVGDAMTVTVRVEGRGNVKLFPRPVLSVLWGTVVPSVERVVWDSTSPVIHGRKEFDWVLTPDRSGSQVLGPVVYSFFDPTRARYDRAKSTVVRIAVAEDTTASRAMPLAPATSNGDSMPDSPVPVVTRIFQKNRATAMAVLVVLVLIVLFAARFLRQVSREEE
jgi:hypothetical protein